MRAYEEIVEFIAAGPSTAAVAAFRPSRALRRRVATLVKREKLEKLSPDEQSELQHYLTMEHLMRLAKARATQLLVD